MNADDLLAEIRHRTATGEPEEAPSDRALRTFPLLRELLEQPELLLPPEQVIPRLAYRSRTTLHVAADKGGKSTLWAHAAAAYTRRASFLGEMVGPGCVVWCGIEEAVGDAVRRFHELGADVDRMRVLSLVEPSLLGVLHALLEEWPADLVVVDSLAEYARVTEGRSPDDGDAAGWGTVVRPLVALGRKHDCAIGLLHHPRRSDGQYRGSGEIAASVDCLWEMLAPNPGEDPTMRRFRGRARWPVEDWSLRMVDGRFELGAGGVLSLDARILADVGEHPGTSRTAQHGRLGGRKATHLAAVGTLISRGALREQGSSLYLPHDITESAL
jgi:hypothetical protein